VKKRVNADDKCAGAQLDKGAEGRVDFPFQHSGHAAAGRERRAAFRKLIPGSLKELSRPAMELVGLIGIDAGCTICTLIFLTRPRNRPWNGLAR
jgi:hypothetical protein